MRVSTKLTKTDRKTIYVNNLQGVDLRKGENLLRADIAKNLIPQNGKLAKRNGWVEQFKLNERIDYLKEVEINKVKYILIYSGARFYLRHANVTTDITDSAKGDYSFDTSQLQKNYLYVYKRKEIYFIFGAGIYLELGDFGSGIELRRVEDDAYVPRTTIGIMAKDSCLYVQDKSIDETSRGVWYIKMDNGYHAVTLSDETPWDPTQKYYNRYASYQMQPTKLEAPNLLTTKRINTIYGAERGGWYQLDGENILKGSVSITIKALKQGDVYDYSIKERSAQTQHRTPEVGDNLKGQTLYLSAGTATCSSLQNGVSTKGIVVMKGERVECYWKGEGVTAFGWNNAKLVLEYYDRNDNLTQVEIAEATRNSIFDNYTVTYFEAEILLDNQESCVLTEFKDHAGFKNHVKANLPGDVYSLEDQNLTSWGTLNHKTGELHLINSAVSPDGSDNVTVKFGVRHYYNTDVISACRFAEEFGVDGNTDRVFVSGNPNYPNIDFASESNDLTYFPTDYVYRFGLDNTPITGYCRLADDTQAIFKDCSGQESNVYVRKGKWINNTVEVGENSYSFYKADFSIVGKYISQSAIKQSAISYLDGNPLYLSREGIMTLKQSTDYINQYHVAEDRGKCVNNYLSQNIDQIHNSVEYKGDYYLSVGDKIIIAKSNSFFYENGKKQYNFWIWENIPAVTLANIYGELYFGTNDGRVCKFSSGYEDVYYKKAHQGSLLFTANQKEVSFNEELLLKKGDKLIMDSELYVLLFDNVSVEGGKIKVSDVTKLGEMEVYVDEIGSSGLLPNTPYKIVNIDVATNTFSLFLDGEEVEILSGGFRLSKNLLGEIVKVDRLMFSLDVTANDLCTLKHQERELVPIIYNGNPIIAGVEARVVVASPVVAVWRTPGMSLNYPSMLKSIHKLAVTLGGNCEGVVKLMAESRYSLFYGLDLSRGLKINDPEFVGFSFDSKTTKTCVAIARFREVSRLVLSIISDEAAPFELDGFSVEYSLLKEKRGID